MVVRARKTARTRRKRASGKRKSGKRKSATYESGKHDVSILLDVLRTNQSMEATAHAVEHIERELKYPLRSLDDLLKMFARRKTISLGDRTVEAEQVGSFLPEKSFPIANREELISRVVMAFERERMSQILAIPLTTEKHITRRRQDS
jgi:hypothetical protein